VNSFRASLFIWNNYNYFDFWSGVGHRANHPTLENQRIEETTRRQEISYLRSTGGNQVVDHISGDSADHHGLLMKSSNESREEAITQMCGILTAKQITRIGTWNVRTAFSTGKLAQSSMK